MKRRTGLAAFAVAFGLTGLGMTLSADEQDDNDNPLAPPENLDEPFRIGYIEGDPFVNFAGTLEGIVTGLTMIGWLENTEELPYVSGQEDSAAMWAWLSEQTEPGYIEFVEDAHYSMVDLSDAEVTELENRLEQDQDLDLMISMGTFAGTFLADLNDPVPFMSFSVTDAVQAGIVDGVDDSGADYKWAHLDPDRTRRQVQVFYDILEFETMGMIYEDSPGGRSRSAVQDIYDVADEIGVEIIEEHVDLPVSQADMDRYYEDVLRAHERLSEEIDAMYITFGDWDISDFPLFLEPFVEARIPTFSQTGSEEVQNGVMLSVSRADFNSWGQFGSDNIVRFLNGASLRELPQVLEDTPAIAVNIGAAEQIGYPIPFEILLVADEIHQLPEERADD